jgi:hypothetical protein
MANSLGDFIGIKEIKLEAILWARVIVEKQILRGIPLDINTEDFLERIRIKNPSLHISGAKITNVTDESTNTRHRGRENNGSKEGEGLTGLLICMP